MPDAADIANDRTANLIEGHLARRVRFEGVSARECIECDTPIPTARQQALPGVQLCVHCQQLQEDRKQLKFINTITPTGRLW